jgi:hypothetical protein
MHVKCKKLATTVKICDFKTVSKIKNEHALTIELFSTQ